MAGVEDLVGVLGGAFGCDGVRAVAPGLGVGRDAGVEDVPDLERGEDLVAAAAVVGVRMADDETVDVTDALGLEVVADGGLAVARPAAGVVDDGGVGEVQDQAVALADVHVVDRQVAVGGDLVGGLFADDGRVRRGVVGGGLRVVLVVGWRVEVVGGVGIVGPGSVLVGA